VTLSETFPTDGSGSLWQATAPQRTTYPALGGIARCDVAVVGAGYTGLAAALALAERGARVCVAEAASVGFRASGRNGGQVVPGLKPRADRIIAAFGAERGKRMLDFAHRAADRTFDLVARHNIDCKPTRNGWIQGAFSKRARDDLQQRAEINARNGGDVQFLDQDEVAARTGTTFHHGGMIERRAGAVHPMSFARGLAAATAAAGGVIHESTRVHSLERTSGAWTVLTDNGVLIADHVILATDGYTDRLWPAVQQSVINVTSAQLATERLPPALAASILPARAGVSETRKITYYYRMDPQDRFVIGGRGPRNDGLDPATVQRIERAAVERFPALREARWQHGWSCRVAMTLDDLPHVHVLAPGLYTALGYCGRGVALAVVLGEQLAAMASGAREQDLDYPITPLRRVPLHPLRQPAAAVAIMYYRMKDRLGLPS
jgi:glycine/D-amino acid oxidase-like deaminating enzyme